MGVAVGLARAVAVISATTVARASGAGGTLWSEAAGEEVAAGAGSPQASDMSDTQRARANDRLKWRLLPPVRKESGGSFSLSLSLTCPRP